MPEMSLKSQTFSIFQAVYTVILFGFMASFGINLRSQFINQPLFHFLLFSERAKMPKFPNSVFGTSRIHGNLKIIKIGDKNRYSRP